MRTEELLLEQLKVGVQAAWEEAFRLLYPSVLAAARHPLAGLSPTEAEDVAIEALTQMVPKVASLKSWEDVRALAITIAGRRAISERRRPVAKR